MSPRAGHVLAAVTSLRPIAAEAVAAKAGLTVHETLHRLWSLRATGVAQLTCLWAPSRAGQAVQSLTYVTLRLSVPDAVHTFDAYCLAERAITAAVALTGGADYALWTSHGHERSARDWVRDLMLRPEVGRVQTKGVKVRFGHLLQGAPVYRGGDLPPAQADVAHHRQAAEPSLDERRPVAAEV